MAVSKVKDENFLVLQGWMLNKLKLKGVDFIVYACIFGFSQNENWFTGSVQYLADWSNSTKRSVYNSLKSLIDKGLLEKKEVYVNNVKQCSYKTISLEKISLNGEKISLGGEKISLGGGEKISLGGGEKISPNNIDINNIDINNIVCISDFKKIADTYTHICKSLKPLKNMTAKRKQAVNNILQKYSMEELEEIFKRAEASDFCKGSREGWVASFDWLMNEDNITKLLEGNYDNAIKPKSKGRIEQVPQWLNKPRYNDMELEELEAKILSNNNNPVSEERIKEIKERLGAS